MDRNFFRGHVLAGSVFAFTLGLRLISLWRLCHSSYGEPTSGDMRFYAEWAQRIAAGELTDFHAFYGQPLYAYLLGGIFALTGFQPALIGAMQAVLDALTGLFVFKSATLCFPETPRRGTVVGLLAAAGWALFIPAAAYSGLLIAAPWVAAAWSFTLWWLLRRSGAARSREWFGVALVIGAMGMMSATILFALPLLLAAAAIRRLPLAGAALCAGVLAGTAPAWLHNAVVARDPVFLSAHSGVNFWIGNNPEANGYPRVPRELSSEQGALLSDSIRLAETAAGRPLPRSAVSAFWSAKAWEHIRSSPGRWLQLLALKVKNFWNRFEYDDLSSITALRDAAIVLPGISFGLAAALGLPGGILALRIPRARWILAVVLLQLIALVPVFVNERYRLAAAPGLLLLAAFFVTELWRALAIFDPRKLALCTVLLAGAVWFVTLPPAAGEPALWSVNDYKTARRQIFAGDFARGEVRLRRAFASMVAPGQISVGVANGFAEVAQEQTEAGDPAAALRTIHYGIRINPASERLRDLQQRIVAGSAAQPRSSTKRPLDRPD